MKRALRIVVTTLSVIFLLWFIAPSVYGVRNTGTVLGLCICIALLFRCGFTSKYHQLKRWLERRRITGILLRVIQAGAFIFILYSVLISCLMVYAMIPRSAENATAVVPGAQVKPWGPSPLLQQRIDAAEEYLLAHPDADAVATGGQGTDEIMSEGRCIYENLIGTGIAPDRIYIEDQAVNTEQNIRYSLDIIKQRQLNPDIAVVTDSYHQLRARIIAHKTDASLTVTPVNTHNNIVGICAYPTYFVREWIAIPAELLKQYR